MDEKPLNRSNFDFAAAISQLFTQEGGRDFAIRLVLWTAVLIAIVFAFMAKPYMSFMGKIINASWIANTDSHDSSAILDAYAGMGSLILPIIMGIIAGWMVYAAAEAALFKRSLKNIDHGFIPLRFGKDEMSVMGSQFVVFVLCIGMMIVLELLAIAFIAGTVWAMQANVVLGIMCGLITALAFLAMIVIPIYFGVRLAPAAALSIQREKFAPLAGWGITYKRPANLFLAYLFLYIAGYIVIAIVQMMVLGLVFSENAMLVIMGFSEQSPQEIFAQAVEKLKSPMIMLPLVLGGIVYMLVSITWWLSMSGVALYAVQWWDKDNDGSGG